MIETKPTKTPLAQALVAETLGTALLVACVVGTGIMALALSENLALALLANALATGAFLVVLIGTFGPVSGAQFNPVVTLVLALRRDITWPRAALYVPCQVLGGIAGTLLAHGMAEQDLLQISTHIRSGWGQALSEFVASFGLVLTILACLAHGRERIAASVGLYIIAAYWFTQSTSFANPAVTLARAFSDTFAGIRPTDVPLFILAQTLGALAAFTLGNWLFSHEKSK